MRIWILNHYATPPDTPGITRHFDLAKELVKRGHSVTIFAAGFNHRSRREERLEGKQSYRREKINGVEFVWIKTPPYYRGNDWRRVVNMLSYGRRVASLGRRLEEKPDVILASSPHPFAGLAGHRLSLRKEAKFIFEVRDLWPQTLVEIGGYSNRSPVVAFLRILEKFLYRRAKKIVVLLPEASKYITGLGIPADKIAYIPNGVSPELFANAGVSLPPELDKTIANLKSKRKLIVGYTGAHGIVNALDTIIKAAKILQDREIDRVHFLMVGDGAEKEGLMTKAANYKLENLSFYSSIPKYAMPALLKSIDVAVRSGRKTGLGRYGMLPNKVFDYMASAKPIIWTNNSVENPVAKANCGISVAPEDPEQMAKAILELNSLSDSKRREMGKRGYEYVMKYHSVPVLADRLLEVIEEATGRSNRAGDPGK
jgi:glycosyltransferase involved in cell wall biosynthesis